MVLALNNLQRLICHETQPKVNVIARLEFELAYYDSAVHRFNHYTTRSPPLSGIALQIRNPSRTEEYDDLSSLC